MTFCISLSAQNMNPERSGHGGHHRGPVQQVDDPVPDVTTLTENSDGTYTINTAAIGAEILGFGGRLPLLITIKNDHVTKVDTLPNKETPRFMMAALPLLEKWDGKKVKDAAEMEVDAVTGATYTSKAIIQNVRIGLEYYLNNKK
ncbi:MAG: FMN-binding protein [Bacteroidales bacterium]|nr:FMN-binding protein [Bacteroidales bacterium]